MKWDQVEQVGHGISTPLLKGYSPLYICFVVGPIPMIFNTFICNSHSCDHVIIYLEGCDCRGEHIFNGINLIRLWPKCHMSLLFTWVRYQDNLHNNLLLTILEPK